MYPDGPVSGGGDFGAFQIQKFIGGNLFGQHKSVAIQVQHGRKNDAMKYDVILPDEVNELCITGPVLLPVVGPQLSRIADVSDGRFKPHVQHLPFGTGYRNLNAPVEVAGHGPGLQPFIQPAFALPQHVGFP